MVVLCIASQRNPLKVVAPGEGDAGTLPALPPKALWRHSCQEEAREGRGAVPPRIGAAPRGGEPTMASQEDRQLLGVKVLHTVVWAFFAGCILAIPILAWRGQLFYAGILCGVVFVEVLILLFNDMRCPLTPVAARYTQDRRANFDIFLPEWLARYNKEIFGSLYFGGVVFTVYLWLR